MVNPSYLAADNLRAIRAQLLAQGVVQLASFLRLCHTSLVIFCLTAIIAIIFLVSACCARYFLNNRDFDKKC